MTVSTGSGAPKVGTLEQRWQRQGWLGAVVTGRG